MYPYGVRCKSARNDSTPKRRQDEAITFWIGIFDPVTSVAALIVAEALKTFEMRKYVRFGDDVGVLCVHVEEIRLMWCRMAITAGVADHVRNEAVRHSIDARGAHAAAGGQSGEDDIIDVHGDQ